MMIENFQPFAGQHCETTATGSLLQHIGIELSEPMLFGLGEGLGFIWWNMKTMDFPFLGGRVKPDVLTENICRNLKLELEVAETSSAKKAWDNVRQLVDEGQPVGLKLDSYHLEYFKTKVHFAGHYVAIYGYDEKQAFLVDTVQQGKLVKTSLESLAKARSEKGPMSSRNRSYVINKKGKAADLKKAVRTAILNNAKDYLNPPISNTSFKGIRKASKEIFKWFRSSKDVKGDFQATAKLMESAGTGGALFRNIYRDFLAESATLLDDPVLKAAQAEFVPIAEKWKTVAHYFDQAGKTGYVAYIAQASELLVELAAREKAAMKGLMEIGKVK